MFHPPSSTVTTTSDRVRMYSEPKLNQINVPGFVSDFSLLLSNNHATGGMYNPPTITMSSQKKIVLHIFVHDFSFLSAALETRVAPSFGKTPTLSWVLLLLDPMKTVLAREVSIVWTVAIRWTLSLHSWNKEAEKLRREPY